MLDPKITIRPSIKGIDSINDKSEAEKFQNTILRPILKLQHELLIVFFEDYTASKKIDFMKLSLAKKNETISKIFKTDTRFKLEIRGLIIGHFTTDEFKTYQYMKQEANKRIITMIQERVLSAY